MKIEMLVRAKDLKRGDEIHTDKGWVLIKSAAADAWSTNYMDVELDGVAESVRLKSKQRVGVLRAV